jgi:hypothetical protein
MSKIFKVNELHKDSLDKNELFEYMSNIGFKKTGIENVVIWVGTKPPQHGHRIKVSNIPNKMDVNNCFVITIPDFEIIGDFNKRLINKKTLNQIFQFIKLNIDVIIAYSNEEIDGNDFMNLLKSINYSSDEINKINEEFKNTIFYEELENLSTFNSKSTGIDNVIILIGPNPYDKSYRIRVSNIPNKHGREDSFSITIPNLEVIGKVNTDLITDDVMNKIFEFININIDAIKAYSDWKILTDELCDLLKPV